MTIGNLIKEAQKQGINRYVVGAIIFKNSKILLLQRSKNDFMGGIYELPSGKVEKGETLEEALKREVKEETGLKVKEIKKHLGYFDYISKDGKKTRQFNFVVTVYEPIEIKLTEHENYVWIDKNEVDKYPITENVKQILNMFSN
jgi:8-oxo-dGTP diphosphatase